MGVINLGILIKKLSGVFLKKSDASTYLSTAGFVKNDDYASSSVGGVVKMSTGYATAVSAGGNLYSISKTAEQYAAGEPRMFICKGTLENVIATLVQRELIAALGGTDSDPAATTLTAWKATKGADGWTITATKS